MTATPDTAADPELAQKQSEASTSNERLWEIDALRGVAIIMMVIYHFTYNLDQFGSFDIGANAGNWQRFANFTAFMFVSLVGVSLVLSYSRATARFENEWLLARKYVLRGLRILGYGMLVTVVVWLAAPGGSIIFGILHLIGLSIIFSYPFLRQPVLALVAGLSLITLGMVMGYPRVDFPWLIWLGFRPEGIGAMYDYRPMIPWFGVALFGIYAGYMHYRGGIRQFWLPDLSGFAPVRWLMKAGQYSLAIYLIHQPVILIVLDVTGVIDLGIF
jgi:uncharacterized membrane protein